MKRQHLRSVTGCRGHAGGAAFKCSNAFFQHRARRVANSGVDVAERLQAEQRCRVIDAFEHVRSSLIDRRRARAGGRIGLRPGVDGERGKSRNAFSHYPILVMGRVQARCIGPAKAVKASRRFALKRNRYAAW